MAWFTRNRSQSDGAGSRVRGSKLDYQKAQVADVITTAIMMVDTDFIVTYVNEQTMKLMRENVDDFRKMWPTFNPENIVGTCIDMFHKHPAQQHAILRDPARLPFRTEITVGALKIMLLVSGAFDKNGKLVGNILEWRDVTEARVNESMIAALNKSQAIIEFTMDGKIVDANENFVRAMGYSLDEIRGCHHSMFVDPDEAGSPAYKALWEKLNRGEFDAAQYRRIGKGGKEVWIQASYHPILDAKGKPFKVMKMFSTDMAAMREAVDQTREVVEAAKNMDLTRRISMTGKVGILELLCSGVNELLESVSTILGEVRASSREVSNAAAEISAATTDLSERTEEQAASLEETSSSMEEIAATVKQNAENAKHANDLTRGTQGVADRGGEVVSQAVSAMARIEESSRKISDIISVIDEIARQTNLLALNAAVEAARAGEAGRGFAVVASEVRSLAQRSSQAAKDIKDLIINSSAEVKDGVQLVNDAGDSLKEIMASIRQVADIVADIATASTEQAAGIEQVNKALTKMDEMTQQNSAMVEQNAATARTLEQQAGTMDERIGAFRLAVGAGSMQRAAAPAGRAVSQSAIAKTSAAIAASALKRAAPVKAPVASRGARQMQAALASAVQSDDWAEF